MPDGSDTPTWELRPRHPWLPCAAAGARVVRISRTELQQRAWSAFLAARVRYLAVPTIINRLRLDMASAALLAAFE